MKKGRRGGWGKPVSGHGGRQLVVTSAVAGWGVRAVGRLQVGVAG